MKTRILCGSAACLPLCANAAVTVSFISPATYVSSSKSLVSQSWWITPQEGTRIEVTLTDSLSSWELNPFSTPRSMRPNIRLVSDVFLFDSSGTLLADFSPVTSNALAEAVMVQPLHSTSLSASFTQSFSFVAKPEWFQSPTRLLVTSTGSADIIWGGLDMQPAAITATISTPQLFASQAAVPAPDLVSSQALLLLALLAIHIFGRIDQK